MSVRVKAMILNQDLLRRAAMIAVVSAGLAIAGCATTGDSTPTPTPTDTASPTPTPTDTATPTPTPTPTATSTIGAVSPPQGASTAGPEASASNTFNPRPTSGTTTFPLIMASQTTAYGDTVTIASDPTTDNAGAQITVDWANKTYSFSLGNSALGVSNVALGGYQETGERNVTLSDGRVLTVYADARVDPTQDINSATLSYLVYGYWSLANTAGQVTNASPFVIGFETPGSAVPTSGSATYNGFVSGVVTLPDGYSTKSASLFGTATVTADFASGALAGDSTNVMATPTGGTAEAWNSLSFNGNIASGMNSFTGTTTATDGPGNTYSLANGASGYLAGKFYGTTAQELGAIWNLSDGTGAATGVLTGTKQ
jgi:hypothetical protein